MSSDVTDQDQDNRNSQMAFQNQEFTEDQMAVCRVCPHHCRIPEGAFGRCRARRNAGGKVICANYGKLTSMALDPIEKKPLAYFHPGSMILSVGSYGCNLSCPFCQNYEISMAGESDFRFLREVSPQELCSLAMGEAARGNIGVAYTYKLITSVTMTVFYVLLYYIWLEHYKEPERRSLTHVVWGLMLARMVLCMFPQNGWLEQQQLVVGNDPQHTVCIIGSRDLQALLYT